MCPAPRSESEEEKKAKEETRKDFEKLCTFIKEVSNYSL